MTYDRKRLDEAINKIAGSGLKPSEIIQRGSGREGPTELRYNAHVAFSTMRRGARKPREGAQPPQGARLGQRRLRLQPVPGSAARAEGSELAVPAERQSTRCATASRTRTARTRRRTIRSSTSRSSRETFSDADLAYELGDITRAANRANTTIYTIDPRGLVAGSDIDEQVDPTEWNNYVRKSQDSMRVLAEDTGGLAVVNQNDFDKALKQIDAASSDYYVLGYYSSNPDPTKRRRQVDVKITRKGLNVVLAQGIRDQAAQAVRSRLDEKRLDRSIGDHPAADRRSFDRRSVARRSPTQFCLLHPRSAPAGELAACGVHPLHRLLQISFVNIRPDEVDAQPRARDSGAAEAGKRVHHRFDTTEAVEAKALLRKPRGKGRRVRPIAIAPLNRLVRDEPGVAAAADAVGGGAPARDVRLVLVGHSERQPVQARFSGRVKWKTNSWQSFRNRSLLIGL